LLGRVISPKYTIEVAKCGIETLSSNDWEFNISDEDKELG
jgi:hypothetical protein